MSLELNDIFIGKIYVIPRVNQKWLRVYTVNTQLLINLLFAETDGH